MNQFEATPVCLPQRPSLPNAVVSFGGGVQSTALLVLAAQGKIPYTDFLFCNVGADSENPKTIDYVRDYAIPYAQQHGLHLIELRKQRKGEDITLFQLLTRPNSRSVGIPVRMNGNGAPGNRSCTVDFKIKVVDSELKHNPAFGKPFGTAPDWIKYAHRTDWSQIKAIVALGISVDEIARMKDSRDPWKFNHYPLIELGLTRFDCLELIKQAGLPEPPKSSCWFCPYHSMKVWVEMREQEPVLFRRACALERLLNWRRRSLGRDPVWFCRKLKPLAQAVDEYAVKQRDPNLTYHTLTELFDEQDACESGYCMM